MIQPLHLYNPHSEGHGNKDHESHKNLCCHNMHHTILTLNNGSPQCLFNLGQIQIYKLHLGNRVGEGITKVICLLNHIRCIHNTPHNILKTKQVPLILLYLNFNSLHNPLRYRTPLDLRNYLHNQ